MYTVTTGAGADGVSGTADDVTLNVLDTISNSISGNVDVLLPVAIGIMAIMVGISLIPRIVYKFL